MRLTEPTLLLALKAVDESWPTHYRTPHARTSAGWQSVASGGVQCKILINAYNLHENETLTFEQILVLRAS